MSLKINIGGDKPKEGWKLLNVIDNGEIDFIQNASDLSNFSNNSVDEIYASHIVEHFDFANELYPTLGEWLRILKPGGIFYISVPDLFILIDIMKECTIVEDRFLVMQFIYGGHVNKYDYHYTGFDEMLLHELLDSVGFVNIRRVSEFNLFDDTSSHKLGGRLFSINMIAEKPV